jgi:hypothetical protein
MIVESDQLPTKEQVERAKARIDVRSMLESPGWKRIEEQLLACVEGSVNVMLLSDTSKTAEALDALRCWQIQRKNYKALCDYVNAIIEPEPEEGGELKLSDMETILQEALHGGSQRSGSTESY